VAKNWIVIKDYSGKIETNLLQVSLTGHSLVSVEQTGEKKEKVKSSLEESFFPSSCNLLTS